MEPDGISKLIEHRWIIAIIAGISILFLAIIYIILPLLDGIVLGVVFAYVGRPINNKLSKYTRLAPFIATACVIVPIVFIVGIGTIEIVNQLIWMIKHHSEILTSFTGTIEELDIPEFVYADISRTIENITSSILGIIGQLPAFEYAQRIAVFTINFIISIFVCFFLLLEGDRLVILLKNLLPQTQINTTIIDAFIEHLDRILAGIFIGNLYVAIVVSIISIFVFYFFEVPHTLAMASLVFLASLIPIFAGWMILVPISISRYFDPQTSIWIPGYGHLSGLWDAIAFYVLASIIIYGPAELVLRPYIIGVKSYTHPLLMMLMFIGGAFVAGIAGFFLAPMLMGVLIAAYRTYDDLIHERIEVPNLLDTQQ